jgi:hypothetical protein
MLRTLTRWLRQPTPLEFLQDAIAQNDRALRHSMQQEALWGKATVILTKQGIELHRQINNFKKGT